MDRFFEQIAALWKSWTRGQKITIVGGGLLSFILLLFLISYITRAEYADLYTNISPEEAGRITSKFEEWKQPYKLEGTTIKVPIADRDKLRLKLASGKLAPTGGIKGWELFDTTKFTMTDYERRINYLRAIQGELERTIESIEGIKNARVLLVLPEKKLFIEEEKPVTGSIKLTMAPYATIDKEQVAGIINLVSFAVEGLKPSNITVVDNRGRILSEDIGEEKQETITSKQLALQEEERKGLERRIRDRLSRVIGYDKVEVIVKYEMSFDRKETKLEKYSMPGFEQLKISEEKVDEAFKGEGVKPEGQPGLESQIPGYKEIAKTQGPVEYNKKEARTNYYADKEETSLVKAPSISKISVGVFVDGKYELDEKGQIKRDKKGNPIYSPRTNDEMEKFKKLVWAAIGAEKGKEYLEREYLVEVENVQFDRSQEWLEAEREKKEKTKQTITMAGIGGAGLIFLIIIGLIMLSIIKQFMKKEAKPEMAKVEGKIPTLATQLAAEGISLSEEEMQALETAKRKPALVAKLVKNWLSEEE
ncbi:MAG: flagellar basal-body MS-ring/collar protein FliF [bacterium]